ncbi:MAG: lipopolysaccharide biosynthesis protein [Bacteroidales bacterium]|nr:lipopolysaccharide biosynthesis protein [Bacteroidales bacterium]
MPEEPSLKLRTARTLKWNLIDRLGSQVLYGITGIVLARLLSQEDFGLVGAVLVFQAFAALFVDSGFSAALIQRKSPTREDYSTVLWFNIGVSVVIYVALWFLAPLIASWFQGDERIIPLARVMFLSFIITATSIVQTNRLMKQMDVRMIAASNCAALTVGAVVGIYMALNGYGAWSIVWQTIIVAAVKSAILWMSTTWRPLWSFSWSILKGFFAVGSGVMFTSFLNTLFQNIYAFFIGNRVGLVPLGYYSQSDKWSKMGIMSIVQTLTSTFLPVLSHVQDSPERYARVAAKTNRFTSYIAFPAMGFLIVAATPIFHALFGTKWDASIILFQLLLLRGLFFIFTALYNNYILAKGKARLIVYMEVLRDSVAIAAIIVTLPYIAMTRPGDIVWGVKILLWGQVIASAITWIGTLLCAAPLANRRWWKFLNDCLPYIGATALAMGGMIAMTFVVRHNPWSLLLAQAIVGLTIYLGLNQLAGSAIQRDAFNFILRRQK